MLIKINFIIRNLKFKLFDKTAGNLGRSFVLLCFLSRTGWKAGVTFGVMFLVSIFEMYLAIRS